MSDLATKQRPLVVVVGGFLGAGKTSLILAAAGMLEERGIRCAVILNDQGEELVDTQHAGLRGMDSRDVRGGCFCCRFSELTIAIDELAAYAPAVIFAEPVGSCTDIAATVIAPLMQEFDLCRVAPLTVLVDPTRAAGILADGADSEMAFLMRKQLEEADLLLLSKADLHSDGAGFFAGSIENMRVSAKTGVGIEAWLQRILSSAGTSELKLLDIDYDEYARAEAALAWMNLSLIFEPASALTPAMVVGSFLDGLDARLTQAGVQIVHLKMIDRSPAGWLKAAICANGEEPSVEGDLAASPASMHELLVNLRALGEPAQVQAIVKAQLHSLAGMRSAVRLDCFSPAPPKPERRVKKPQ